ncbi:MAG: M56 family metallopeptidase [Clostridiaceae bacterium]|nr:M56 family metallopeptidase [Clostridiaceae bacterium]
MVWLYRVFYTVFSMGIVSACLLPLVLLVRFFLRNLERKHMIWEWRIVYLRSVCPVALSSIFCAVPAWNRKFHQLLADIGLTLEKDSGVMRSWRAVFEGEITTTVGFRGCAIIWIFGVAAVLFCAAFYQIRLRRALRGAALLGENIYEAALLRSPVQLGVIHRRLYLPKGFQTRDLFWLLRHMEKHRWDSIRRALVTFITALHWFNPVFWLYYYWWNIDLEMHLDDRTLRANHWKRQREYAQAVLNFDRETRETPRSLLSMVSVGERGTAGRARRLMYQRQDSAGNGLSAVLLLSLTLLLCFFLLPIRLAWAGGTWGGGTETEEEALFGESDNLVVAKVTSTSPEGLDRVVQLEMTDGTEGKATCQGSFQLVMYDSFGNEITACDVADYFGAAGMNEYTFTKGMALCAGDYNGDSVQEIVLGQKVAFTQKDFEHTAVTSGAALQAEDYKTYSYSLINIEDQDLPLLCEGIYVITDQESQCESANFDLLDGTDNVFQAVAAQGVNYYVWQEDLQTYEKQELTQEQIEAYRQGEENTAQEGEVQEYTLENEDGDTCILVTTKQDSTGTQEVQSVTVSPRSHSKKWKDIRGYYCDLMWLSSGEEENRYALLLYNGTSSQTFTIYDVKRKKVYFSQEDGNSVLSGLFQQYGEDEIVFAENDAVIYNVQELEDDILKISFAANTEDGGAVSGTYSYDTKKGTAQNLSFNRSGESTEEP